jgi:hypothetical protein
MMAGLGGIGAAVSGLAQGVGQGLKLRNDMEDAQAKRDYMARQGNLLDLQAKAEEEKQAAGTYAKDVTAGYYSGNTGLGFTRNEDGSYDPQNPANINRYYDLSRQSAARFAAAHGQDPNAAIAMVDKLQQNKYAEGVSRAAAAYGMGDLEQGDALMRQVSSLSGMTKKFVGTEQDPANPGMVRVRYADKDGKESTSSPIKLDDLANKWIPFALDPAAASNRDLAERKLKQEDRQLTIIDQHYQRADNNDAGKNLITQQHYNDWYKVQKENVKNEATKIGLMADQVGLAKVESATSTALNQLSTLVGFNPKFDATKASETDILKQEIAGAKLQSGAFLQQQGGFDKNGFKITSAEAANLAQQAYSPENLVNAKQTKNGMYYVDVNGTAVPIIGFNENKRAALQKQLGQQPAASNANSGAPAKMGITGPDSTKYIREKSPRGGWVYTPSPRGLTMDQYKQNDQAQ